MRATIISLLCFVCAGSQLQAQPGYYSFQHLGTGNGLSDGRINSIAQDKYGFIWIATNHGLNKFNGYTVETFGTNSLDSNSVPEIIIKDLLLVKSGRLFIATQNGLCEYNYATNSFKRYPFGLNFSIGKMIEVSPGIIWMHSAMGILIVDENKGSYTRLVDHKQRHLHSLAARYVHDFATNDKGQLFIGTSQGLYRLDLQSCLLDSFLHDPKNDASISHNDVRSLCFDKQGNLWLSTRYYGSLLDKFDLQENRFIHYDLFRDAAKGWADNRILDMLCDRQGNTWISSLRSGLAMFDPDTKQFNFFMHDPMQANSIVSNSVVNLFEDKSGMIWVGSEGYGVDYFHPSSNHFISIRQSYFQQPTLADNSCRAVAEDESGKLWIATYKGLSVFDRDKNAYKNYLLAQDEQSAANNSIRAVLPDNNGYVWIGTGAGLNRYDSRTGRITPINQEDSIPQVYISHLFRDKKDSIWVCTVRGLFRLKSNGKFENVFRRKELQKYLNRHVSSMYQDRKGRLWLSFPTYGVLSYDQATGQFDFYELKKLDPISTPLNYISAFAEDAQGLIWMTSVQGLIVLDAEKKSSRQFRLEQGLPSLKTSGVLVDSINRIWFGTSNGLCMLDAARHHVYRFDENDGLPTTYFYEGPAQRLSNGNFAFSSYQGLVIFKPENIMTVKSTVPVYLTGFRLYGKDNDKIGSSLETKELSLKHDQNYFNLEITGLYFNNPSHIRYAYKLDGFDKDWHYSSDRHINYTNVPGGKYTFRFKAGVQTELDNAPERQLTLLIGTVFYKTWWFIALVIGIIALLVYVYIRNKFQQQSQIYLLENRAESLEKEKAMVMYENLQQQLNPHFLFNSLTSLRSLIKINPAEAGQFLDRMSSIYRYILQNRDKELVTLKEEMQFVQSFIDLQRKRFGEGLNVQVKIPEADLGFKVVPVTLQNLIENAIKHNRVDEESPLLLEIYTENDFLVVRNNLQKKEFVESSNRQGLKNLKALYEYLDERPVQVIEEGNYFIVRVPLVV